MREGISTRRIVGEEEWDYYRSAISVGGLVDFAGVPVLQEWFHKIGEGTPRRYEVAKTIHKVIPTLEKRFYKSQWYAERIQSDPKWIPVSDDARKWFALKFGYLSHDQIAWERSIREMKLKWSTDGLDSCSRAVTRSEYVHNAYQTRYFSSHLVV